VAKFNLDLKPFEKFLHDRIKVGGKTGNLGEKVSISVGDGNKIVVDAEPPFSKRYLKYLSKKYLKANDLRDYMHVVANHKDSYQIKLYKTVSV
jgi:large subunit ribosomal protein L22e